MIKLTINDIPLEVEAGTTVLEAAKRAGISIPTLCNHPKLTPYGSCRLCLVQVQGARTLQTSCALPAAEGMVVQTETEAVKKARQFVLSMLFSERNHFCMYCQETDGDCDLQQAAYHEGLTHWPITPAYLPFGVDASHPDFILDNNRCILCRRCVRTCDELVGNATLGFEERGSSAYLVADYGVPLGQSSCISCGNCVQMCPTGALIDRQSAYRGRSTDLKHQTTVCTECALGCLRDAQTRDGHLVRLDGWEADEFAEGLLCELGRYRPLKEFRLRLQTPMIRREGTLQPASWDEALRLVATQLKAHGSDQINAAVSPRQNVESLYAFRDFFKESFQLDHAFLLGHDHSAELSQELAADIGSFEASLQDLKSAGMVVVLGTDLTRDHPVAGFIIKRQAARGMKLLEITNEPTHLTVNAANALNLTAADYGPVVEILQALSQSLPTDTLAGQLGWNALQLNAFSGSALDWSQAVFVIGKDFAQPAYRQAFEDLMQLARSQGAKVLPLKGKANATAAARLGLKVWDDPQANRVFFLALGDGHHCEHLTPAFAGSEFKIVHAAYASELTDLADVILPAAIWSEENGHYLSSDSRLNEAAQLLLPQEQSRTLREVLAALAQQVGIPLGDDWQKAIGLAEALAA